MSNESNNNQITPFAMPYQVPVYPVVAGQDAPLQPTTVVSNLVPVKPSNTGDFPGNIS